MTTKCDHTEAIAKEFYAVIAKSRQDAGNTTWYPWDDLSEPQREAFRDLANQALPIIAKHAMNDVKDYLGDKANGESGIKKILLWLAAAVVGGLATLGLTGCGHDVVVTPEAAVITKDGSAVVIRKVFFSFSQPTPDIVPPVIIQPSKK